MEEPNFNPQPEPYRNQAQQPQPPYQPQPYQNPGAWEDTAPLSVGACTLMFVVSAIPVVNIIMLFVWGFGNSNRNRKNWARAQLIITAVVIVLCIIFGASIMAALGTLAGNRYY